MSSWCYHFVSGYFDTIHLNLNLKQIFPHFIYMFRVFLWLWAEWDNMNIPSHAHRTWDRPGMSDFVSDLHLIAISNFFFPTVETMRLLENRFAWKVICCHWIGANWTNYGQEIYCAFYPYHVRSQMGPTYETSKGSFCVHSFSSIICGPEFYRIYSCLRTEHELKLGIAIS